MTQIILHIGTHKTGTTSIQRLLALRYRYLLKQGILFPESGRPSPLSGQHQLGWSVLGIRGVVNDQPWQDLLNEIGSMQPEKVLISAEAFTACDSAQVEKIRQYFLDYEVKIILYLRNQLDYMLSDYKEAIKAGKISRAFRDYLQSFVHHCDYCTLIQRWEHIFGPENFMLRLFDKAKENPGLLQDYLIAAGLDKQVMGKRQDYRINISPSEEAILLIRWLNRLDEKMKGSLRKTLINEFRRGIARQKTLAKISVKASQVFLSAEELVEDGDINWLRKHVSQWNHALFRNYIAPEDQKYFEL